MGARGPLPKKRILRDSTSNRRVRGLPSDAAAIYRRLVRDIAGLDVSDAALRDLAAWFSPPLRIDESIVQRRITELEAIEKRHSDPLNWD